MYHYAGNNPVRYTDPDGRYLINTKNAEAVAINNKRILNLYRGQPLVLATNGRLYNINVMPNNKIFLPQKLEESIKRVIRERNTPSMFVKTYVYATYDKLDENLYKINVVASVTIETEKGIFFIQNEPETVAYATAAELGITVFNKKPDQNEVNNIANQVLSYAKMEIKVDD